MSDPAQEQLEDALRRAAEGDERAWRHIVDHYSGRVFGLVRAQCGDSDLAEEITQSTFCTLAAKIGTYVESGRFEAWLFRIAMNRLRDEMRRRKRQALPTDQHVLGAVAPGVVDEHADALDRAADVRRLREAIGELGEADQRVIHLRHHAGMSFRQIADHLEEPLGTILARHHRALRKLRDRLEAGDTPDARSSQNPAAEPPG